MRSGRVGKRSLALGLAVLLLLIGAEVSHPQQSDLETAGRLNQQALKLYEEGRYREAVPIAERALAIREKALGPEHPDVAASLNNLAELYKALGDYARAEPLYRRSLAIVEKALGPEQPDVATSLNNLAGLYRALGDYARAEPLYRRSLAIAEKALGPEQPDVATSLNNLAELYKALGDYAKAEPLYRRSLAIREKALGPEHPNVATSLNNLAELYRALGDYPKAEPLHRRALAISERALGPEHPHVALSLNNLAGLYGSLGDYAKAEPLYRRSLAIREKALGPDHPHVATSLNNLAELYHALGDYAKAEPLFRRSLAIWEKALGPEHPDVATSLNNLAALYHALGDYAKAEPLHRRSLAIREKALGPEHPDVATSLNNLAELYRALGDYAKAEPLFRRALATVEKALGPEHLHVAISLNNLAGLYAARDDFQGAHGLHKRAQEIDSKLIDAVLGFTSEEQKMIFLATKRWTLSAFLSLVSQHFFTLPSARKHALDVWLQRKGVILEAQKRFQDALVYSDDPEAVQVFQALATVRTRLSRLIFAGPGKEGAAAYQERIATLEREKGELEAKLSRLSQAFATRQKTARADSAQVARTLPPQSALVDFAKVDIFDFKAKGTEKKWLPARYLAFVLLAGQGDRVGLLDLGETEAIDRLVAQLKKAITDVKDAKRQDTVAISRQLHEKVFAPLQRELGPVKEVFIAPDGNLNLLPFEVLQGPDGKYLIEEYTFYYLASGRDLLGFGASKSGGGKALLLGDPDFDLGREEKASTLRQLALAEGKEDAGVKRSAEMRGFHFSRLPGTRHETREIHALLGADKAELYTDKQALEEVLRQKGTPRILHLATHGFFLSDVDLASLREDDRGMRDLGMTPMRSGKAIPIENPLVRSGIALAGANRALAAGDLEQSDGLVTAEKILGLRLRGTDLVVLSACETGLGEVKSGEGVFGLRRAFTQAGAKSLVMSLWAVPDRETRELMVAFYQNILSGKMNRAQALRQAALSQMQVVKGRYGEPHPFFWGAFVFLGEP